MTVVGTVKNYAILRSETGQVSLVPRGWLTVTERQELLEHLSLRSYPPALGITRGEDMTTKELKPITDDELKRMDLPDLEQLHSEMLATASDIGFEPSDTYLVTIETVAQGASICKGLHEQITKFIGEKRLADDLEAALKKPVADVPEKGDTAKSKSGKKKSGKKSEPGAPAPAKEKSVADKMAEQKAARLARDAAKQQPEDSGASKEITVVSAPKKAKKAAKKSKKSVAKKGAKKSGAKRSRHDPASKIHWIRTKEGNGAREGTPRHARREGLRKANGQTVATYLKNGGKSATLARAVKDKDARVEAPAAK